MRNKLEENYNLLQRKIYDITKNIHKVQNKNHKTMSTIVEKLKYIEKDEKPSLEESGLSNDNIFLMTNMNKTEYAPRTENNIQNLKLNNYLRTCTNNISSRFKKKINNNNYKKYQPVIHLYKNYKNDNKSNINFNSPPNKKYNNTIDNCNTVAKDKFFLNKTKSIINKENDFNKLFFKDSFDIGQKQNKYDDYGNNYKNKCSKTIDFKTNRNKTIQNDINFSQNKLNLNQKINFNKNTKHNLRVHSKNKYREYYWSNEFEKLNDSINNNAKDRNKNNIFFGDYERNMKKLHKNKINSFKEKSDIYYKKNSYISKSNCFIGYNRKNRINKTYNKINDLNLNFNYSNNLYIEKIKKYKDTKNNPYLNLDKVQKYNYTNNHEYSKMINDFSEQKKFVNKMMKIYNKYNPENKKESNYQNILLWINKLIHSKQKNKNDDKYEFFCKQLMKENNIKNFSIFKNFARNIFNEKKNENNFFEDIKKILSVEDNFFKENISHNIKRKNE